jgi:hypothetical protein
MSAAILLASLGDSKPRTRYHAEHGHDDDGKCGAPLYPRPVSADPATPPPTPPKESGTIVAVDLRSASRSGIRKRTSATQNGVRRTGPQRPLPPVPRGATAPGLFLMAGVPMLVTAGVVGLAAVHHAIGDPLGPKWAADLWDMVRSTVSMWLFYGPFTVYVQRRNAQAAIDGDGPAGGAPLPGGRNSPRGLSPAGKEAPDDDREHGRPDRTSRRRP